MTTTEQEATAEALDIAEGGIGAEIGEARAGELLEGLLDRLEARRGLGRVLIVPPDMTRLHSWGGWLTCRIWEGLERRGVSGGAAILPALGTHAAMTPAELDRMFPGVPHSAFQVHDWREGVATLGEIPREFIRELSGGRLDFSARVQVNRLLVDEPWDAILSVGQLVPHEVIGIANHAKNIFVGVGGFDLINKTHWLGAVVGIERIMGKADTPVRAVFDEASRLAAHLPISYLLTVRAREAASGQLVTRGLYAGEGRSCFDRGAALCREVNLDRIERAPSKVVVYLDPAEFKSTWLGNKAIYRTRMAIADAGELVVLAPGVKEFGEDHTIDRLIRRHGYRGTPATLSAVEADPELAANLSAAAHLIHGSTEGRFSVTYCPGHLTRGEVEGVNFRFGDLGEMSRRYPPDRLADGWNLLPDGEEIYYISNPALGLWGTADRFD